MRLRDLMAIGMLAFAACAGNAAPAISTGDRYGPVSAEVQEYRLGPGDKVKVNVFNEPTLSGETSVSTDGVLAIALIGNIQATGKTAKEVSNAVQTALADGYLRDPKVSVEITSYRPFFLLGEVKTPGQFPYATSMTALNAIALAQGFSPRASKKEIFIRGAGDDHEERYKLTPDLRILPGDTIRVGERYF